MHDEVEEGHLIHAARNAPVESTTFESQLSAACGALSLLAGCEATKILSGPRYLVNVELQHDATRFGLRADDDVQVFSYSMSSKSAERSGVFVIALV